jgi:hypothetical protein
VGGARGHGKLWRGQNPAGGARWSEKQQRRWRRRFGQELAAAVRGRRENWLLLHSVRIRVHNGGGGPTTAVVGDPQHLINY